MELSDRLFHNLFTARRVWSGKIPDGWDDGPQRDSHLEPPGEPSWGPQSLRLGMVCGGWGTGVFSLPGGVSADGKSVRTSLRLLLCLSEIPCHLKTLGGITGLKWASVSRKETLFSGRVNFSMVHIFRLSLQAELCESKAHPCRRQQKTGIRSVNVRGYTHCPRPAGPGRQPGLQVSLAMTGHTLILGNQGAPAHDPKHVEFLVQGRALLSQHKEKTFPA